ncbi:putative TIR domain, P-loop containing nucleoside triphosphate hydrolase [Medicago truncatula]|uniref:Putative TIR domain, P-loop containing nucleoside triphosphate hydrolase n=1 Tax=Medicago truncatula TaxID=3880 RepID=G7K8G6_MEDTR|nr:TIR-like domain protein TSDC protein [Medicago truncatula]RHN57757.1 putative TIR domain, P-loop containing nucleoside triphosphate hydrolase [Medicago truncatula]
MSGKKPYAVVQYGCLLVTHAVKKAVEEVDGNKCVSDWFGKGYMKVERQKKKLISNRDRVRAKVEAIDRKTEKVRDVVFEWLKEADIIMQKMENLKLQSKPPSWIEFNKLQEKITALNKKCNFDPFSTTIPSLEHFSLGNNFECFKSTEKASDELLEALQDDNCCMIGLYGRRDSGKTTLVKVMEQKVQYLNIFDEILFVNVTKNPNITAMQDEIADFLNIRLDRNSETGRARKILSTIEDMDRPILVIFDDVRAKFDLRDVGIPCNSNLCKVLLTARRQKYCDLMHCQREILLDPLSTEEASTLFEKHSGILEEDHSSSFDLFNVAREVAFECDGLPGRIIKEGSFLRSKSLEEWEKSLHNLRHSTAQWQMFLSFRGEDTRYSFTGSLFQALSQGGFKTFMDDEGLHTGDRVSPCLRNAIEASRLSIIVLSENYANSTWCLDELVKILECKKWNNQLVWPIFYKVEPSDIRHLRKSYGKDMAQHERRFGIDSERVQKWKSALLEVSNLSGMTYTTGFEYEFIQKIVEDANHIKSRLQIQSI